MSKVVCPGCRNVVPNADLNRALALAKCRDCQTVFPFEAQLPADQRKQSRLERALTLLGEDFDERARPNGPLDRPAALREDESAIEPTFTISWYNHGNWVLALFCLFWDGFLVVWFGIVFATGAWIMGLFAVVHLLVGVVLSYIMLTGFFNSTVVVLGRSQISVQHGPLPALSNAIAPVEDLKRIYVTRSGQARKDSLESRLAAKQSGRATSPNFDLVARLRDGSDRVLLTTTSVDIAQYLEQRIEQLYRIESRPMRQEA